MDVQTGHRRRLSPQCETVLNHLRKVGNISPVEAGALYRIRALPRRVKDLKDAGIVISSERKEDLTGQRYVRYRLPALAGE